MTTPLLTLVVPTYNRPTELARLFDKIAHQRDPRVRFLVLDNHSEIPARSIVPADIDVIRHSSNIGSQGNISRAFEIAQTPWIWICGDDDLPEPDAIKKSLDAIEKNPEAGIIYFSFSTIDVSSHQDAKTYTDIIEFSNDIEHIFPAIWISRVLYRREICLPLLLYVYSFGIAAPHFTITILSLVKNIPLVKVSDVIVRNSVNQDGWNMLEVRVLLNNMLNLPLKSTQRRALANALRRSFSLLWDIKYLSLILEDDKYIDEILTLFESAWLPIAFACRQPFIISAVFLTSISMRFATIRRGLRLILRTLNRDKMSDRLRYVPRGYRL